MIRIGVDFAGALPRVWRVLPVHGGCVVDRCLQRNSYGFVRRLDASVEKRWGVEKDCHGRNGGHSRLLQGSDKKPVCGTSDEELSERGESGKSVFAGESVFLSNYVCIKLFV